MTVSFDRASFWHVVDMMRRGRGVTWHQVAEESGVTIHVIQRHCQSTYNRNPGMDTFAKLVTWAGLDANAFITRHVESETTP